MANLKFMAKLIIIFVLIFLSNNSAQATEQKGRNDTEETEKMLKTIADFADRICGKFSDTGEKTEYVLSGEGKVELNRLLKMLTDAHVEIKSEYQNEKYQGVLQNELAETIKSGTNCRKDIFNSLKDKLTSKVTFQSERIVCQTADGKDSAKEVIDNRNSFNGGKIDSDVIFVIPAGYKRHSFASRIDKRFRADGDIKWKNNDNPMDGTIHIHLWTDAGGYAEGAVSQVIAIKDDGNIH
ncbi:MAG: hypothetical protein HQK57_08345 [Deltaproteobacteria bacterium]|nr:hypothetical protein [Deltaproteobacteria bacterium]MBF0525721.1 hypothetical protein [Deltaproteobacteria bacterium]